MTNLKISALIIAATTAFAAPAFANANLAASLGVDANAFTTNQLIQLKSARDSDDTIRANAILSKAGSGPSQVVRTAPDFVIEHATQNGDYAKAAFLKELKAGNIDSISEAAAERTSAIFDTQFASEENRGS